MCALVLREWFAKQRTKLVGGGVAFCKCEQHGQRVHAFFHVVSGRLAKFFVGCHDVEQVVHNLEDHAKRRAVIGERIDGCCIVTRDNGTNASRS